MDNRPDRSYNLLAIAVVLAAVILGAAIFGSSIARATATSVTTTTDTETSVSTETQTLTSAIGQVEAVTQDTTTTDAVTTTVIPAANSTLTVGSVDQNGEAIAGHFTLLGGIDGSLVVAEGLTPDTLNITVGQTYSVRAENNGSCTFSGWSDGAASDPRTFNATSGPVSYTAEYNCGNAVLASPIYQSCTGYSPMPLIVNQTQFPATTSTGIGGATEPPAPSVSCTMSEDVRSGDLIVVKVSDLPGLNFSDSMGNAFTLLENDNVSSTYHNFIYYAIAASSGPDTLTVRGYGNYPSIMAVELQGLHAISSYEVASGDSNVSSVSAFTPAPGSFVLAFVEPLGPPISVSFGPGYTMEAIYAVSNGCEYGTVTGLTTSYFTLGASAHWEEVSLVFT